MKLVDALGVDRASESFNRACKPLQIGTEPIRQRFEEGEALRRGCGAVGREQGLRQGDAGCFTAARQEQVAQREKVTAFDTLALAGKDRVDDIVMLAK